MTTTVEGVKRTGPPVALQKLRDNFYMVQVPLSESPSADWKRLFYDTQQGVSAEFLPRSVEMMGAALRFRSGGEEVASRMAWIDKWIERANQKEASRGGRLEEERKRRREELAKEHQELAELNARWANL
ncbi:MAG TPA: hypothetical protein VN862_11115 [Candidatus Acidoferrales bacterium]|nr:hypothetical protein [Candidatus Acidoferrales bacterium]